MFLFASRHAAESIPSIPLLKTTVVPLWLVVRITDQACLVNLQRGKSREKHDSELDFIKLEISLIERSRKVQRSVRKRPIGWKKPSKIRGDRRPLPLVISDKRRILMQSRNKMWQACNCATERSRHALIALRRTSQKLQKWSPKIYDRNSKKLNERNVLNWITKREKLSLRIRFEEIKRKSVLNGKPKRNYRARKVITCNFSCFEWEIKAD